MENNIDSHSYTFMNDGPDTWKIKALQDKILEIMVFVDKICREHGITYYLMSGSALGAIRHNGFIPWDDDLDIFMTPKNYELFTKAFNNSAESAKFYLQEWGKSGKYITQSKVRMNNTAAIESCFKTWNIHQGIFIDIFMLHNAPNSKLARRYQCLWARYLITKGLANKKDKSEHKARALITKIVALLPKRFLLRHALKVIYKYDKKDKYELCSHYVGRAGESTGTYQKKWFQAPVYVKFEKVELMVATDNHAYMEKRWGDYMKIPPIAEIKRMQHCELWSADKSYHELLDAKKIIKKRDESYLIR